jgi:hypothetical protein
MNLNALRKREEASFPEKRNLGGGKRRLDIILGFCPGSYIFIE